MTDAPAPTDPASHADDLVSGCAAAAVQGAMPGLSRRWFLGSSIAAIGAGFASGGPRAWAAAATAPRPSGSELAYLSVRKASALIRTKKISPVELTRGCLARIDRFNPVLNAFVTVTAESALAQARHAETEVQKNRWRGPLHGIPMALKDLIDTAGVRTTAACGVFKDRIPAEDATVVRRLKDAGAVLLGKLNMHECAYGGTSVTSFYGSVKNPWDVERISGGSSGGSAAAVAAGLCYAALGSDTGGSIRAPASLCGIVGLKPTYGRVSNRGVLPLSWSLDHVGPMTRSVTDAALVMHTIAGYDHDEPTSQDHPLEGFLRVPWESDTRLRIGVPRDYFFASLDPEVEAAVTAALRVLETLGGEIQEVPLEVSRDRTVIRAEAYAYHADHIAKTPELYQPETLGKLRLGADIESRAYIKARRELDRLRRVTQEVFLAVDVLVTPTTPAPAPRFADWPAKLDDILAAEGVLLRNTRPFNMYGIPTLSVPCGMTAAGMPIGLQISGPRWAEARLIGVAAAFERATDWHRRQPRAFAA
jgi:aspartyl-tRNA(Asn)/glutamyl-tRNA(Gln) amidotransferase subunit A